MRSRSALLTLPALLLACVAVAGPAGSGYDKPPQNVLDVLHAPSPPQPYVSPTRDAILLVVVGGVPADGAASPSRSCGSPACASSRGRGASTTRRAATASRRARSASRSSTSPASREVPVALPPDGCAGRRRVGRRRQALRVPKHVAATPSSCGSATRRPARCTALGDARLNPMLGSSLQWMPDQKTLLVKLVPDDAGAPPPAPVVAGRPEHPGDRRRRRARAARTRRATRSRTSTTRTSSTTTRRSQLALVDARPGAVTPRRQARRSITDVDAAPDGEHILVDDDPQAVLVRHDVRPLPARRRGLGPRRRRRAHARVAAARRSRADRTACRPARATSSGARPSRRRSSGPRRSTAATGTSRSRRATR